MLVGWAELIFRNFCGNLFFDRIYLTTSCHSIRFNMSSNNSDGKSSMFLTSI
jgi:hypothetical protein